MAYLVLNEHFLGKDTDRKDNFKTILFVFEHFYDYSECPKYFQDQQKTFFPLFATWIGIWRLLLKKAKNLKKKWKSIRLRYIPFT